MLKERDLDIVLVGSPGHWHALHTIAALEAGADVYCQKSFSRLLGKIRHVDMCCFFHMRFHGNPPLQAVPDHLDLG